MDLIIKMVIALAIYDVIKFALKSWFNWICTDTPAGVPKYENPPPPPRKSFKERLVEKVNEGHPSVAGNKDIKTGINYGYQPTDKVDTSNPPKETGT